MQTTNEKQDGFRNESSVQDGLRILARIIARDIRSRCENQANETYLNADIQNENNGVVKPEKNHERG